MTAAAHMPTWGFAQPLHGFLDLIRRERRFGLVDVEPATVPADGNWNQDIKDSHRYHKKRFKYIGDGKKDIWKLPDEHIGLSGETIRTGDCEDWCLLQFDVLAARGVPFGSLRIAVCTLPWLPWPRNGHAVLTIEMPMLTLVSDVRMTGVLPWYARAFQDYRWVSRQVPGRWWWARVGERPKLAEFFTFGG